ncbi:BLUF domain-containing protein [Changchengzhania lutea]|uniref:BLUF domain-containing protein n=1 Tax=Changchengzhania lutea TaxID=2049305 RepID=UPI00115CF0E7|nr:BLUF domain-containing protein [Changchengzhania lutea]
MIYTICYVSSASHTIQEDELNSLFESTKTLNHLNSITGILLYLEGNFLQILEGEERQLKSLMEKIEMDDRHHNIIIILNKKNKVRIFKEYNSGFSIIKSKSNLADLKTYLYQNNSPYAKPVSRIIEPFLL